MANGGNSEDLERLETQLEATRSELAGVAGAVNGLTTLVTDFLRRSSGEHQEERWQARLGSLETRLEMLETAIRSEVERMRATAGAVDAMADEFRSTVGGTRNLVDLAGDIGDRLGDLRELDRQVRGAAQEIATIVESQLEEDKNDRRTRDSALIEQVSSGLAARAAEVEHTIAQSVTEMRGTVTTGVERVQSSVNERVENIAARLDGLVDVAFEQAAARARLEAIEGIVSTAAREVADLGRRFDAVALATSELPAIEDRLANEVREATAWGDVLGRLTAQVGGVHGRLDDSTAAQTSLAESIMAVASDLATMRTELATESDQNLRTIAQALLELSTDIKTLARQVNDTGADHEQLVEITNMIGQVRAQQPQLTVRLDQLAADLAELRSGEPDPAFASVHERLDAMVNALRGLAAAHVDPTSRLDAITVAISELPTSVPDNTARFDQLASAIEELRSATPDPSDHLDRLTAAIDAWRTSTPNYGERFDQLSTAVDALAVPGPDYSDRLRQISETIDALRSSLPDHSERFDRLTDDLATTRAAFPDVAGLTDRVAYLLDQQMSALIDLQAAQAQTGERLDRIVGGVTELQSTPPPAPQIDVDLEPLARRLDAIVQQIEVLRAAQPSTDSVVERVASVIESQSATLAELEASQPPLLERVERLADDVARVAARPVDSPATLQRLDRLAAEVAELRVSDGWLDAALAPLAARLETVHVLTDRLAEQPDIRPVIEQLSSALDSVRTEVSQSRPEVAAILEARLGAFTQLTERLHSAPPEIAVRLDQVQAELADLRTRTPDVVGAVAPLHDQLAQLMNEIEGVRQLEGSLAGVNAEIAALRAAQPDPDAVAATITAAMVDRLDRITAEVASLRGDQPDLTPVFDALTAATASFDTRVDALAGRFAPLGAQLDTLDARSSVLGARVEDALTAIAGLHDVPDNTTQALTPVIDRLAIVVDGLSAMHRDVTTLAESIATLRTDRAQLVQMTTETNAHLDQLAATIAELPTAPPELPPYPDYAPQFADTNERIDQLSVEVAEAARRAEAAVAAVEVPVVPPPPDYGPQFADLTRRVETLSTALTAALDDDDTPPPEYPDYTPQLADITRRVETLSTALTAALDDDDTPPPEYPDYRPSFEEAFARIDRLASAVNEVRSSRPDFTSSFSAVTELIETLQTRVTDLHDRIEAVDRAIHEQPAPPPPPDVPDHTDAITAIHARVDEMAFQLARRVDELSGETSMTRELLRTIEAAVTAPPPPPPPPAEPAIDESVPLLGALSDQVASLSSEVKSAVRATVGLGADVTSLRSELKALASSLDEPEAQPDDEQAAALARIDAAIAALASQPADNSSVLDAISRLAARDNDEAFRSVSNSLGDVRAELAAIGRAIDALEVEVSQPAPEPDFDANELIATTASAMSVLEGRMDGEFDSVGRQMEALGTLLTQVIDAMHRVETQIVGAQPGSEHMRAAASTVLESLRANVRQRGRRKGPPPELGTGT